MKPDPRHVRAASGAVSNVEALWKGLPSQIAMRAHVQALQRALSEMLPEVPRHQGEEMPDEDDAPTPAGKPRKIYCDPTTDKDLGPGEPDDELGDALERLGRPDAVTIQQIYDVADVGLSDWLIAKRSIARNRMANCGYERVRNPTVCNGCWRTPKGHAAIYTRRELTVEGRMAAAETLVAAMKAGAAVSKIPDANPGHRSPPAKSTLSAISASEPAGNAERPQGQLE